MFKGINMWTVQNIIEHRSAYYILQIPMWECLLCGVDIKRWFDPKD